MWAQSVACGVPDELFWRSTPVEVGALLDEIVAIESRREQNASLRAALIAAEVKNTLRSKRTDKYWTPWDFLPNAEKPSDTVVESPEQFKARLLSFATAHNARRKSQRRPN